MLGRGNIRLPELAGKFKSIFIFGLLSISIIILIIISHVELHNKTLFTVQQFFMPYLNFQPIFNQFSTNFQPNKSHNSERLAASSL